MKFQVVIDVENAAFELENRGNELARILRQVADKVEAASQGRSMGDLRDINGNWVGRFGYVRAKR